SRHYRIGFDIATDDGIRADHGAGAYPDPRKDHGSVADPDVAFDDRGHVDPVRARPDPLQLAGGTGAVLAALCKPWAGRQAGHVMGGGADGHPSADAAIADDEDMAMNMAAGVDVAIGDEEYPVAGTDRARVDAYAFLKQQMPQMRRPADPDLSQSP